MSFNVTRLTLYALLASLETDLRNVIRDYIIVAIHPQLVLESAVYERALHRLKDDLNLKDGEFQADTILDYIDFADAYKALNTNSRSLPDGIAKYLQGITPLLEQLVPIRNRVAHSRPLNFDDLAFVSDTCQELLSFSGPIWTELTVTAKRLKEEPSFVLSLQIPAYYQIGVNQSHNLPPPDFDETGFIGRTQQVKDLIRNLLGPYPVVTIIGEGGVGKTALALKVAYDILDLPSCPFDAVVWTTSKTRQLTPNEVTKIEGAISNSLGMFQSVAYDLSGIQAENPMDEILLYLEQFKILLVLDNLETVLDNRIRNFLDRLPQGSKVLITSRIGLGAYEYPVKLKAMEESEAVALLRALAKSRGLGKLTQTNNRDLAHFCAKMHNSPGFIKWFVSAVQAGRRPEEVLANPDTFLEFCMSNVYEYLEAESRLVLDAMLCVPTQLSQAELAFLTEMDIVVLQRSLQQLMTTNMVVMTSIPKGSSFASGYELSDLPRNYLLKYHPPTKQKSNDITKRRKQLVAAEEQAAAEQRKKPYSPYSIVVRSPSDLVVARYLQSAMFRANDGYFEEAERMIRQARNLAPEYFEVYRIDAWVKTRQRNITAAQSSYEAAIDLEPNHAPLLYSFGLFLLTQLDDSQEALKWFSKAAQHDAESVEVQLALARANLYLKDFNRAESLLSKLVKNPLVSDFELRKGYDLFIQHYHRLAEYHFEQQDIQNALDALEKMRGIYQTCPPRLLDQEMKQKVRKAYGTAVKCQRLSPNSVGHSKAAELVEWIYNSSIFEPNKGTAIGRRLKGKITNLVRERSFGFIRSENQDYYFQKRDLFDVSQWELLHEGCEVRFVSNSNEQGLWAVAVAIDKN